MFTPGSRRTTPWIRVAVLSGTSLGLVLVALFAVTVGPLKGEPRPPGPSLRLDPLSEDPLSIPERPTNDVSAAYDFGPIVRIVALAVAALVMLALVGYLVVRWRNRLRWSRRPAGPRLEVLPDLIVGQAPPPPTVDRTFDTRVAAEYVIACWEQVERAGAAIGCRRRPEQTATEFLQSLDATRALDEDAAGRLLRLYQHARFDHTALTADTAAQARAAVSVVLDDLRSSDSVVG